MSQSQFPGFSSACGKPSPANSPGLPFSTDALGSRKGYSWSRRHLPAWLAVALFVLGAESPPKLIAGTVRLQINAIQPGVTNPVCVRASIKQSNGSYLDDAWWPPSWPPISMHGKAMAPGLSVQVPTGPTQLTIAKGPDYLPQTMTINLAQDTTVNVTLQPVLDLYGRGWRTAEMHLHYLHGEQQILRAPQEAWAICAAGGLNLVLFCEEHYGAGSSPRQQLYDLWTPYQNTECQLGMGVEEPKNAWGHHATILSDPWAVRSSLPYFWGIHTVHQQGGVSYAVHPSRLFPGHYYDEPGSGQRTWFLYPFNNFNKAFPLDALIGHLLDGWSSVSDEANSSGVLPAYFKLLSLGYKIPLLADSDFCMDRLNNDTKATGGWMTYYYLGNQPLTRYSVAEAMRQGRVMCTTGPLVLFNIDNAMPGDTLPADGAARTVRIQASYSFNAWTLANTTFSGADICRIAEVDLYRNGQLFQSWKPNSPTATLTTTIRESATNSWYMVRVQGNEGTYMAGYASPIYFDNALRPRQPPTFKALIRGRLYDAASGQALTGTVACVRYGQTNWTIPTDSQGRFQAYTPLDADLVARDSSGRSFTRNILQHEPVYAFCNYLADNYSATMETSVDLLQNLVQQMTWEFPLGYQSAGSYMRTNLTGDAVMSNFSITSAPSFTSGKNNSEIVMLLVDKTQVQAGDTIKYAAIYRSRQQPPSDLLGIEWKGWNPNYPNLWNRYNQSFLDDNNPNALVSLGNGFYLRQGSAVVPTWAANATDTTAGLKMWVTVRPGGIVAEDASLLLRIGPTQRGLLVSTTWDGLPASWGEIGLGPCNFRREYGDFLVRYSDYRSMTVNLTLNGQPIRLSPKLDTAHVADADDAAFYEPFYYDGQCEPQWRNIPFRDPVRAQPPPADFNTVPIQNPPDSTPPTAVAIQPANGGTVAGGNTLFYFLVDDAGLSGPASATIYLDGLPLTNATASPVALTITQGNHTWQVKGFDNAGNSALSSLNSFFAAGGPPPDTNQPPPIQLSFGFTNNLWQVWFASSSNWLYLLERATALTNPVSWTAVTAPTPGNGTNLFLSDPAPPANRAFYRVRTSLPP